MQMPKLPPIGTTSFQSKPHTIILRCAIAGFRRIVNEIFALVEYYVP
jgi:hypothetical protein